MGYRIPVPLHGRRRRACPSVVVQQAQVLQRCSLVAHQQPHKGRYRGQELSPAPLQPALASPRRRRQPGAGHTTHHKELVAATALACVTSASKIVSAKRGGGLLGIPPNGGKALGTQARTQIHPHQSWQQDKSESPQSSRAERHPGLERSWDSGALRNSNWIFSTSDFIPNRVVKIPTIPAPSNYAVNCRISYFLCFHRMLAWKESKEGFCKKVPIGGGSLGTAQTK